MLGVFMLSFTLASHPHICLSQDSVVLERTGISVEPGASLKVYVIDYNFPVSCKSGRVLAPRDYDEALDFMDLSLPLDLKSAATQGAGSIAVGTSGPYSRYGGNADSAVLFELGEKWSSGGYCKKFMQSEPGRGPAACTFFLYNELRRNYMPRKPWDLLNGVPSTPPSADELDQQMALDPDRH